MRRRPRPESVFDSFRNFHDEMGTINFINVVIDINKLTVYKCIMIYFHPVVDQSSDENTASRRKTLEQLFRPPIDLIFRGSFRAVSV